MKYKNYLNNHTFNRKIYSAENMLNMTLNEFLSRDKELIAQYKSIGVPNDSELSSSGNVVYVHEYTRDDGTEVRAHWRSKPNTGSITGGASSIDSIVNDGIEQYLDLPSGSLDALYNFAKKGRNDNDQMNLWEELQDIAYEQVCYKLYSNSSKLLRDAMHNFSEAKKNKNVTIKDSIKSLDKNIQNEIQWLSKKEDSVGVIYNENSEISKLFSGSPQIKNFVKNPKNINKIINNEYKKEDGSFEFKTYNLLNFNGFDRFNSLQHVNLFNPIVKDGYLYGTLVDYYNFDEKRGKTLFDIPNDWGYDQEQKGILKNYYICVKIKVKI